MFFVLMLCSLLHQPKILDTFNPKINFFKKIESNFIAIELNTFIGNLIVTWRCNFQVIVNHN